MVTISHLFFAQCKLAVSATGIAEGIRIRLITLASLLCLTVAGVAHAEAIDKAAQLRAALRDVRFVAYTPTDFAVINGQPKSASAARIGQDLTRLRPDFQGLITYSCANGVEQVPAVAARLGYRALILGVWDPTSKTEVDTAVALARRYPGLVVGIALGNETLLAKRLTWPVLRHALEQLRIALPDVAVTTSEPFYYYLLDDTPGFLDAQDFLLPSVHPLYQPWFKGSTVATDVDFVIEVLGKLAARTAKPILVKETGLPSGPRDLGFTPEHQARFWYLLSTGVSADDKRAIAYFEAFDQPWKAENARVEFGLHSEEGHWGLYDVQGRSKPVLRALRDIWRPRSRP
jgi:exo-beta-1,3-glucanase (GH17 family)